MNFVIFSLIFLSFSGLVVTRQFPFFEVNSFDDQIDFYTLKGDDLTPECQAQNKEYLLALLRHGSKDSWAFKMLDASSKLQSGIASMNLDDLGAFDQCINVEAPKFNGKYCLASLTLQSSVGNIYVVDENFQLEHENFVNITNHVKRLTGLANFDLTDVSVPASMLKIKWSICVPSACTANDVEIYLNKVFRALSITAKVKDSNCQTKPLEPKLGAGDWTFISFLIIIGLTVISSTVYDIYNEMSNKKTYHPLLTAFSWYTNGKKLVSTRSVGDQIPCLNGIRFLSMMWVIGGHQYAITAGTYPSINKIDAFHWLSHWSSLITIGSTVSVDSFFCLSGCLLMYGFLKSRSKGIYFNIPLFYLHRYLRLTPALIIMVIFQITILRYVSSGPLWVSSLPGMQQACYDYWWSVLLYLQNYINPNSTCLAQTWYLQIDMQLFILSPLILLPIAYWPKYAKYIFAVLVVTFVLTPFGIAYKNSFEPGTNRFSGNPDYMKKYYAATQARAGAWIVGLALGYLLYNTKNINVIKNKKFAALGWILTAIVMLYIVFGLYPNQQPGYTYHRWYASLFIGLHRVVWCIGLSWIVLACVQGYGGIVNTILSLEMFQVLGRLSYSMYLTHFTMLMVEAASARTPIHFSNKFVIFTFWGTFMYTLILSVIWVLCFEYPVGTIDGLLFRKKVQPKSKADVVEER